MRPAAVLLLALLSAGCLPNSGRKVPRGLFAADSLSSALGRAAPVDTLAVRWAARLPADAEAEFVSGISLSPLSGGRTALVDTKSGTLHGFDGDGRYAGVLASGFDFPYTAGRRGDTLALLERGGPALTLVDAQSGRTLRRVDLPDGGNAAAWLGPDAIYLKTTGEDEDSQVRRLTLSGAETDRYRLDGPWWRHLGYLRPWGDTLVSLSGYRPVVDLLPAGTPGGATLDSLALMGFDSPQLERSRQFAVGAVDEPPLLSSAAAALGPNLYVLNLRTEGLRIDVYGRDGRIVRALTAPNVGVSPDRFLMDLDVREGPGGGAELAVLQQRPEVLVTLYQVPPERAEPDDVAPADSLASAP